jgi:hypothetical protein
MPQVAVGVQRPQILATLRFGMKRGFDLRRNVPCVHIIQNVLEGGNVHTAGLVQRIYSVIQSDVPDVALREIDFRVLSAHDVVAAQAGEVLGNDQIDAPFLNVRNHPLKSWTVKICTRKSIVNIGIHNFPALFPTYSVSKAR